MKSKLLYLTLLAFLTGVSQSLVAPVAIIFSSSFESSEGFSPGDLNNQSSWLVDQGTATVSTQEASEGEQSVEVEESDPFTQIRLPLNSVQGEAILFIDLHVKPVATSIEEANEFVDLDGALAGFFKIDDQGEIYVLDGNGSGGGDWVATGHQVSLTNDALANNWIHLTFRQDFEDQLWDLYIDRKPARRKPRIPGERSEPPGRFCPHGNGDQFQLCRRDYGISRESTLCRFRPGWDAG